MPPTPFPDGNGRLARILLNWALAKRGLPFVVGLCATEAQRAAYIHAIKQRSTGAPAGRGGAPVGEAGGDTDGETRTLAPFASLVAVVGSRPALPTSIHMLLGISPPFLVTLTDRPSPFHPHPPYTRLCPTPG